MKILEIDRSTSTRQVTQSTGISKKTVRRTTSIQVQRLEAADFQIGFIPSYLHSDFTRDVKNNSPHAKIHRNSVLYEYVLQPSR